MSPVVSLVAMMRKAFRGCGIFVEVDRSHHTYRGAKSRYITPYLRIRGWRVNLTQIRVANHANARGCEREIILDEISEYRLREAGNLVAHIASMAGVDQARAMEAIREAGLIADPVDPARWAARNERARFEARAIEFAEGARRLRAARAAQASA